MSDKFQRPAVSPSPPQIEIQSAGRRYGKMTLAKLMTEEMKTEDAYNKSLEKEKALYDKYLAAMSERAVRMEQWLNAQREVEIWKRKMGISLG